MSRNQEIKTHHSSFLFSLFSSNSTQKSEESAILQNLKIEIKQLAKIINKFEAIHYSFLSAAIDHCFNTNLNRLSTGSAPLNRLIGMLSSSYTRCEEKFLNAKTWLDKLTLKNISDFPFEEQCIVAMAVAEIAKNIAQSISVNLNTALRVENLVLRLTKIPTPAAQAQETLTLFLQTIANIRSLGAQGQGLYKESVKPVPFAGPGFSLS